MYEFSLLSVENGGSWVENGGSCMENGGSWFSLADKFG